MLQSHQLIELMKEGEDKGAIKNVLKSMQELDELLILLW